MPDDDPLVHHLLGHKWMPQIIAVLLAGPHRFSELRRAVPGIGEKILSRRLLQLEQAGIVTRLQYLEIPPRVEYRLTSAGRALDRLLAEMDRWNREVAPGIGAPRTSRSAR
jgi:DNA-binding HxlR family transcriptional regulator